MKKETYDFLSSLYYDPNKIASFTGHKKLLAEVRRLGRNDISSKDVKNFLEKSEVHSLFTRIHGHKKKRPRIISFSHNYLAEVDCAYMWKKDKVINRGYIYFVLLVNVFNLKTYCRPLKSLKAQAVSNALEPILRKIKIKNLRSDAGPEFQSVVTQNLFRSLNVNHYINKTTRHAQLAENRIKFCKRLLRKICYYKNDRRWYLYLPLVTKNINSTSSRVLAGLSPNQAEKKSDAELFILRYQKRRNKAQKIVNENCKIRKIKKKPAYKYKLGSLVRFKIEGNVFKREYDFNASHEIFLVSSRKKMDNIEMYKMKSMSNEDILGYHFIDEIIFVSNPPVKYHIKEILMKKKDKLGTEYFKIRLKNYYSSFDSWLTKDDIENYKKENNLA